MKIIRLVLEELTSWAESILAIVPGRTGNLLRRFYHMKFMNTGAFFYTGLGFIAVGKENIKIGDNVRIMDYSRLYSENGSLTIGNNNSYNTNVTISANNGKISIGNDVLIGNNVVIRAANHAYKTKNKLIRLQGHCENEIVIGGDVWIGANCVVLPGAIIGNRVVITAGSVVRGTLCGGYIYAGNPAKKIKDI